MQNKKSKIGIRILILIGIMIVSGSIYYVGQQWNASAKNYISSRYSFDIAMIYSKKEGRYAIFHCRTIDDYGINFQLKCWWGSYATPWGNIPFLPERKFQDDFIEKINEHVMDGIVIEGASVERILSEIRKNYSKLKDIYDYYSLDWQNPSYSFDFSYHNKVYKVDYAGESEQLLRDRILRMIE